MVGVSASVNLPLHHEVQKFSSGTGSPGWSRKKGRKTVVVWCVVEDKLEEVVLAGWTCFCRPMNTVTALGEQGALTAPVADYHLPDLILL